MSFWDGKKVLVTGGGGFIGSHTAEMLLTAGQDVKVTVADDFSRGLRENLADIKDRIRIERAQLQDMADCRRVCRGQDVVINLAAKVGGVGYNAVHPATMFRENVRLSTYMMQAAQEAAVERFAVISSACVYRRHCTIPTPETEGFAGWPEFTNEGYGWAKRMAEFEAEAIHKEFGMKAAILRPYNCYGPRDHFDPKTSHVIAALIQRVLGGENPVRVWGDGSQTRAFLYVEDFARGVLEVTERYAECDPINLGADEEVPIRDLIDMIIELTGSRAAVEFDTTKPAGQPRRNCDTKKAREKTGFTAQVSLKEGLRRTIEWYKKTHETKLDSADV
ncbi:MAG: NAD-dependent epimerase/dehydratase family protein [Elusimicrobiota bacterium]